MSIAIKRLERAIADLSKGGMQTGSHKVKIDLADAERLIVELNALQADRDALAAQSEQLQKLLHFLITDIEWHHTKTAFVPLALAVKAANFKDATKATPEQCLAAHDAEVAKKAVQAALRMYGNPDLSNKEIIALSENYEASLNE